MKESDSIKDKIDALRKRRNQRFLNKLSPFEKWLYFSKDMDSLDARRAYFLSPKGEKEIKQRFGNNLDKMPKDWDELKLGIEYDEGKEILDFLKSLFELFGKSWGLH